MLLVVARGKPVPSSLLVLFSLTECTTHREAERQSKELLADVGIHITAVVIRRRARKLMEGSRNRTDVLRDEVLESFIILLIRPFCLG
jgi:ABC-type lipopolysaccharide export system ATPase subunit